jgi:hypothetical protein
MDMTPASHQAQNPLQMDLEFKYEPQNNDSFALVVFRREIMHPKGKKDTKELF